MKIFVLIVVVLEALHVQQSVQESPGLLKVSLYYEALCPGCRMFITRQLYPSYRKIGSSLLLDFTPYGNAKRTQENGTWVFNCQHGPDECAINKIEACGLAKSNDQAKQMEFVNCIESHAESEKLKTLAKCATKLGLTASEILKCSQGPEGNELLAKLGDKQDALVPKVIYVPWIIFNDQEHDPILESHAFANFLKTACDLLDDKPEVKIDASLEITLYRDVKNYLGQRYGHEIILSQFDKLRAIHHQ